MDIFHPAEIMGKYSLGLGKCIKQFSASDSLNDSLTSDYAFHFQVCDNNYYRRVAKPFSTSTTVGIDGWQKQQLASYTSNITRFEKNASKICQMWSE